MKYTTAKGRIFNTELPAKSNLLMVLDGKGRQTMDSLRITGNHTIVKEFMEDISMIEVECSFGITEVNEDFIWQ